MKYPEYLKTAERHLATCQNFFDSMNWTEADQWTKFNEWLKEERFYKKECNRLDPKKKWLDIIEKKNEIWLEKKKKSLKSFTKKLIGNVKTLYEQNNRLGRRKYRLEIFATLLKEREICLKNKLSRLRHQIDDSLTDLRSSLEDKRKSLKDLDHLLLEDHLLKDLFYLSGYILEAFTVYLVYRRGNFPKEKDIEEMDITFSKKYHIDYYKTHQKKIKGKVFFESNRKECTQLDELNKVIQEEKYFYSIEGHNFFRIMYFVLRNPKYELIQPSENIPLFKRNANKEIEDIIRKWSTKLRYSSEGNNDIWEKINLTPQSLKQLIDLCKKIKEHPCCKL